MRNRSFAHQKRGSASNEQVYAAAVPNNSSTTRRTAMRCFAFPTTNWIRLFLALALGSLGQAIPVIGASGGSYGQDNVPDSQFDTAVFSTYGSNVPPPSFAGGGRMVRRSYGDDSPRSTESRPSLNEPRQVLTRSTN